MKNKKLIYILLPAVILLWGYIIFKMFFSVTDIEDNEASLSFTPNKKQNTVLLDTFTLWKNYSDPFLKNDRPIKSISSDKKVEGAPVSPKKIIKAPENIVWPQIHYGGLIKRMNENKPLAIVKINGKSEFMRQGETIEEIKVLKIYADSIIISYKKQDKTIIK